MGLKRGFLQAGAQNLFLTLWKVSDEATAASLPGALASGRGLDRDLPGRLLV